jgi:hypothetical protein
MACVGPRALGLLPTFRGDVGHRRAGPGIARSAFAKRSVKGIAEMITRMMKRVGNALSVGALAGLSAMAVAACSAGDEAAHAGDNTSTDNDFENVGSLSEAISKNCWDPVSTTVVNGFASPYVSEADYADCYKAKNVEITRYGAHYAVGGHTRVSWAGAAPSDAGCLASHVTAYLFAYENGEWKFVTVKTAHGDLKNDDEPGDVVLPPRQPSGGDPQPIGDIPPGVFGPIKKPISNCALPAVYFYGDDMRPLVKYRISATARLGSGATVPIRFGSSEGRCGGLDMDCCTSGLACNDEISLCSAAGKCESCGSEDEKCCFKPGQDVKGNGGRCFGNDLTCQAGGYCKPCGNPGGECCHDNPDGKRCDDNSKCGANGALPDLRTDGRLRWLGSEVLREGTIV